MVYLIIMHMNNTLPVLLWIPFQFYMWKKNGVNCS